MDYLLIFLTEKVLSRLEHSGTTVLLVLTTAQQLLSNCSATAQPHIIIGISAGVGKHSYFIA
ncbi:MAG: hypothetical protein EOM12_18660 [Verrucomicrobiae bacterium]|nr:hypothetical protein [Verrucomicrobiae bacterium]